MSTKPNENNVAKATEIKPATESGLLRKTKNELTQIILRQDDEIKSLKNERDDIFKRFSASDRLNSEDTKTINQQEATIKNNLKILEDFKRLVASNEVSIAKLRRQRNRYKTFNIVFIITTIAAIYIAIFM